MRAVVCWAIFASGRAVFGLSAFNVKASSSEGIGGLGRGDGMAAAAIVLLEAD